MNNVVIFLRPRRPRLECLYAGPDGFFVCRYDENGIAQGATGPFVEVHEARAWAIASADDATVEHASFDRWAVML